MKNKIFQSRDLCLRTLDTNSACAKSLRRNEEKMQKIKTEKFWHIMLLILLGICLLPILRLALYNHSSADDYSYGCMARWAWVDTHNLLSVFGAVLQKVRDIYFSWQGSYSAIALFALQPSVFGEGWYKLTTYLVLGVFLFATFHFCRRTATVLGGSKRTGDIVACVMVILCIELLPSPVEGLYWWNGATYYVVFYALFLIQASELFLMAAKENCSAGKTIGLCVLGAVISGGNYISALLLMEVTALCLVYCVWKKKKATGKLMCVFIVTLICFLVNCLAPGNAVRQATFEAWSPVRAVLYSYHEAYTQMVAWTSPLVMLGQVFLLPFLWRLSALGEKKRSGIWGYPAFAGIVFSLFASSFTPTLYTYGSVGAGRIQNIRYFFWILVCMVMELTAIGLVKEMMAGLLAPEKRDRIDDFPEQMYGRYAGLFFAAILFLGAFFAGNTVLADDTRDLVSVTAFKSLYSGEARQYDKEAQARTYLLLSQESNPVLEPYSCKPELLFWEDIKADPGDWVNVAVARFYRKETVQIRE